MVRSQRYALEPKGVSDDDTGLNVIAALAAETSLEYSVRISWGRPGLVRMAWSSAHHA